jgi:hypothetical protein
MASVSSDGHSSGPATTHTHGAYRSVCATSHSRYRSGMLTTRIRASGRPLFRVDSAASTAFRKAPTGVIVFAQASPDPMSTVTYCGLAWTALVACAARSAARAPRSARLVARTLILGLAARIRE